MLFNRKARIEFSDSSLRPITDLRIAFKVDKNDGGFFNSAIIRVYNLNETSRKSLARVISPRNVHSKSMKVSLFAGHSDPVHLITGDLLEGKNYRVGPDWITIIDIKSGIDAGLNGFVQNSYRTKTPAKKIIEDMLSVLNMDIQYTDDALVALQNKYTIGYSYSALAIVEIRSFLSAYGLEFTIEEHNQCLIYKKYSPREKGSAKNNINTFKPGNGLIGTPTILRTGVEFKSLLRPNIKILQRIFVESVSINSSIQNNPELAPEYYVKSVSHNGDTHSDDWYTEIEAYYTGLEN